MKKSFSKIKWFFVMAFATVTSFVSKVMWQAIESWGSKPSLRWQSYYWVEMPESLLVKWPTPSEFSQLIDTVVKCVEVLLFAAIFVVWLVGFLKIRKIDDKDLKSKKIKRTVIAIVVLLVIWILVWLWYRLYKNNILIKYFDNAYLIFLF